MFEKKVGIMSADKKITVPDISIINKPYLIELKTYRHLEHCGPNNDDNLKYRNKDEVKKWLNRDPINQYKKKLLSQNIISKQDIQNQIKIIHSEINQAFRFARNSNFPSKKYLKKFIYA